ncbi:hypothetical protein ACFVWX_27850 [Streptomyces sp. NPDC058220]|uniref:hypothetical protein n=1 Tax=Streptomyces sp. NPDC058220 TaxID=3346387 RepID=UPI0036EB594C
MAGAVRIGRAEGGRLHVITPLAPDGSGGGSAPNVLDSAPGVDVAVLDVAGGHLTWSVLALEAAPAAVLDDVGLAQEWVWAVYGERVALALADANEAVTEAAPAQAVAEAEAEAAPALPGLVASARRLAFAHWAARWWPASLIDSIPALDERLLDQDIGDLTEECDLLFAAQETTDSHPPVRSYADTRADADADADADVTPRAADYALAAGPASATADPEGGLTLARGTGGSDWRRYPPGLVDASERAVSWVVVRADARTTVTVNVVAAPGPPPAHPLLTPRAAVSGAADQLDFGLRLVADSWLGDAPFDHAGTGGPDPRGAGLAVDVYLPGFGTPGPPDDPAAQEAVRARVRDLARSRLARARASGARAGDSADYPGSLLRAEIAAASDDTDF